MTPARTWVAAGLATAIALAAGACDRGDGRQLAAVATTTTAVVAAPETAESFVGRLAAAIDAPDHAFLLERLHPEVLALYGEEACRAQLVRAFDASAAATVVRVGAPAPWTWAAEGKQVELSDAVPAELDVTVRGRTQRETLHVATGDGAFRWFSDCGESASPAG